MNDVQTSGLNREQSARFLGISVSSFDRGIRNKRIPQGFRVTGNGHFRWHRDTLEQLLKPKAA